MCSQCKVFIILLILVAGVSPKNICAQKLNAESAPIKQMETPILTDKEAAEVYLSATKNPISQINCLNYIFLSGTEGYKTFRIPAIVTTNSGKILAFAEGRVKGS